MTHSVSRRQFLGTAMVGATAAASTRRPASAQDDPLGVRPDFPIVERRTYLNSAYIAPVPTMVADAARRFAEAKATAPISLGDMLARTSEVRRQFAALVNADPREIGFLYATSEGENVVVRALDLAPGDNVVVDELHFVTSYVLYRHLEESRGIELRVARNREGAAGVAAFEPLVDDRTRLVSIAWVSHQNGFRHDVHALANLAHAHGAFLYADAVQAVGMFPVDVRRDDLDFFTTGTYKWLLGGYGVAPFFVRQDLLDRVPHDRLGHLHVEKDLGEYQYQLYRDARKYEYATLAFGAVYQLGAALTYLERVGVDRIEAHAVGLAAHLRDGLTARGFRVLTPAGNRSSIVAVENPAPPDRAERLLEEAGIEISFRENGTQMRISPALFNTRGEIDRFLGAAERLR